ncbi:MAG: TIGR03663 family protein [Verrucomicrobia bacterium]|nr:TIGR03663 family protein [Verrucomicrobiota bacterium]
MKRIVMLVILGLLVWAGFYLRFVDLGQKPMHTDEAVNGLKIHQMLAGESVAFDPAHYHGPLLRYLAIPVVWAGNIFFDVSLSEASLRWLTALAGSLAVLSIFLYRNYLGPDASFIALVLAAVSPPLIYYSRYFIHESVFLLFSLTFLILLWRFWEEKSWKSAVWAGMFAGLLHAVRETVVLVLLAAVIGLLVSFGRDWRLHLKWVISKEGVSRVGVFFVSAVVVSILFYSAFFTHFQGVLDSILTFFTYKTEEGHEKPWYYYLGLIIGEKSRIGYLGQVWVLLFALAGCWQAFFDKIWESQRLPFLRFIAAYTLTSTVLYSLIPYKTPWLMINFLVGWVVLAGVGWVYLWSRYQNNLIRGVLVILLLGSMAHSVRQSWLLSFRFSSDSRNPFVYSHTSADLIKLVDRIEILSKLHLDGNMIRIDVAGTEYWPLPWYLRDYPRIGYWSELPSNSAAPIKILSFSGEEEVPEFDEDKFISELRGLREGVFLLMFIEKGLWERQFPSE